MHVIQYSENASVLMHVFLTWGCGKLQKEAHLPVTWAQPCLATIQFGSHAFGVFPV